MAPAEQQFTWPDVLSGLVEGRDLDRDAARWAMGQVLAGEATSAQIAGFAVALRAKGETVAELAGLSQSMLDHATPLTLEQNAVDVVGSGGDRSNTVNVSTMAAVVAAGAGARVIKHGNRAASSACGAADVIEALGVPLDVPPEQQADLVGETGITFLFAPIYHSSLRHAAATRKELGIRTTFNILGPLSHPGRPHAQAIGVADQRLAALIADLLAERGTRAVVFHGDDGLDELTTTTTSHVWLVNGGAVAETMLDPADLGIARATVEDLRGGDAQHNARVMRETLDGAPGPVRDIVTLNAAAALLAWRGPDLGADVVGQLRTTLSEATESIDSGRAKDVLDRWVQVSSALATS